MNTYRKIEFWTATALFLFGLFTALSHTLFVGVPDLERIHGGRFRDNGLVFDYYINYLLPHLAQMLTMYLAFITLGYYVMGRFIPQKRYDLAVLAAVGCLAAYFFVLLVAQTYERADLLVRYRTLRGAYMNFAKNAFVKTLFAGVIYAAYALLQLSYLELLSERVNKSARLRKILVEVAIAIGIWVFLTTVTFNMGVQSIGVYLLFMSPAIIQSWFLLQYRVLPDYFNKKINKWIMFRNLAVVTVLATVFCFLICLAATNISGMSFFLVMTPALVFCCVWPVAYARYNEIHKQKQTVKNLEVALGSSSANLDFLRSQINPHFLFNALNTLYGTALQEDASRTSEGIQKLGDMMRFMLHENHQEQIKLGKELAYLHNYISLQRLRIQASDDIQIDVNIDDRQCEHVIAPMLLIPFVENAFKHGISLRNRSRISITLNCDDKKIYFDVHNSVHQRPDNDPERYSLGIGLNNVRNRLDLLYPGKHELTIRQTAAEFFVHLTIEVSK